jgi:hypothetical protein
MKFVISLLFYLGLQVSLFGNVIVLVGSPNSVTSANYGDDFTLSVVAYDSLNNGPLYYTWQRNGSTLAAGSDGNLNISNFSPYHEGAYTVDIQAIEGSRTLTFSLSSISSGPPSSSAAEYYNVSDTGSSVTFDVQNNIPQGPYSISWYKDGSLLTDAGSYQFRIDNIELSDAGTYKAEISNSYGFASQIFVLDVSGDPPQDYYLNDPGTLQVGDRLDLSFNLNPEDANAVVTWYKDGQIFPIDSDQFVIENVNASNAGEYYAVISNDFGQSNTNTVNVVVEGDPPQDYYLNDPGILYEDRRDRLDLSFDLYPEDANAVVTWYKDGQIFPIDSDQFVIENVNASNAGKYYAVITNDFGQSNTNTVNVVVTQSGNERDTLNDLGYYTPEQFENLRIGSTIITPLDGVGTLSIQIEKSNDLNTWTSSVDDILTHQIPLSSDKQFFRLTLPNAE